MLRSICCSNKGLRVLIPEWFFISIKIFHVESPSKCHNSCKQSNTSNNNINKSFFNKLIFLFFILLPEIKNKPNDKLRNPNHCTSNRNIYCRKHVSFIRLITGVVHNFVIFQTVVNSTQEQSHHSTKSEIYLKTAGYKYVAWTYENDQNWRNEELELG